MYQSTKYFFRHIKLKFYVAIQKSKNLKKMYRIIEIFKNIIF